MRNVGAARAMALKMAHSAQHDFLTALKEKGVDDFGSGYTRLNYLRSFPAHTLKIDQSFVRRISGAGEDPALAMAVIAMAHSLKLRVVVEGVESIEELTFLHHTMR